MRVGLPCEYEQVARLSKVAVCNVYAVPGPVSLPFETGSLDALWGFVFQHADGVIYESDLVRDQVLKEIVDRASFETLKRRLGSIRLLRTIESSKNEELEKAKREYIEKSEASRRELDELQRELDRSERDNRRLAVEIREREREIADLRQSRAWRWTAPVRRLVGVVMRNLFGIH